MTIYRSARKVLRRYAVFIVVLLAIFVPILERASYPWRPLPSAVATRWVEASTQPAPSEESFSLLQRGLKKGTSYRTLSDAGVPDDYLESLYRSCVSIDRASQLPSSWKDSEVVCRN